jgi:hypothetical protein
MSRFTITLSGLAEADAARFRAALESLPPNSWRLVDGQAAYLMVVDIDTVWGHMDWLRATASDQRVVAYTERDEVRDCEWLLAKPLQPEALANLLDQVAGAATQHPGEGVANATSHAPTPAASAPIAAKPRGAGTPEEPVHVVETARAPETVQAVDTATATPPPARTPEPTVDRPTPVIADTPAPAADAIVATAPAAVMESIPVADTTAPEPATLGERLLAGNIDQPLRIEGGDGIVLQLDPEHGGYYGPLTLKSLQPLLSLQADAAQPLDEVALAKARLAPALPLTRLLWFAALCATPGRLADGLDPSAPYRLTRWPQIEREFPRHFRIATTMMKQPGTLEEVAAAASAPVGDVADFINAYCMAGYVAAQTSNAENATETAPGMLSRLRRPFARGSQGSA